MEIPPIGKWLIGLGVLIALTGVAVSVLPRAPWLGRLPGDIYFKRDSFSFYFPLTTCLIVSLVITLLLRLFRK